MGSSLSSTSPPSTSATNSSLSSSSSAVSSMSSCGSISSSTAALVTFSQKQQHQQQQQQQLQYDNNNNRSYGSKYNNNCYSNENSAYYGGICDYDSRRVGSGGFYRNSIFCGAGNVSAKTQQQQQRLPRLLLQQMSSPSDEYDDNNNNASNDNNKKSDNSAMASSRWDARRCFRQQYFSDNNDKNNNNFDAKQNNNHNDESFRGDCCCCCECVYGEGRLSPYGCYRHDFGENEYAYGRSGRDANYYCSNNSSRNESVVASTFSTLLMKRGGGPKQQRPQQMLLRRSAAAAQQQSKNDSSGCGGCDADCGCNNNNNNTLKMTTTTTTTAATTATRYDSCASNASVANILWHGRNVLNANSNSNNNYGMRTSENDSGISSERESARGVPLTSRDSANNSDNYYGREMSMNKLFLNISKKLAACNNEAEDADEAETVGGFEIVTKQRYDNNNSVCGNDASPIVKYDVRPRTTSATTTRAGAKYHYRSDANNNNNNNCFGAKNGAKTQNYGSIYDYDSSKRISFTSSSTNTTIPSAKKKQADANGNYKKFDNNINDALSDTDAMADVDVADDVENDDEETMISAFAALSVRSEQPTIDTSTMATKSRRAKSAIIDEKILEKYKYDRNLTNSIDSKYTIMSASSLAGVSHTQPYQQPTATIASAAEACGDECNEKRAKLKKKAQSGFFASNYAKLAEKRMSLAAFTAGFGANLGKASTTSRREDTSLRQNKNRSKTSISLLSGPNFSSFQQQQGQQQSGQEQQQTIYAALSCRNNDLATTSATVAAAANNKKHQRQGSLLSLLPASMSSYRLSTLLGKSVVAESRSEKYYYGDTNNNNKNNKEKKQQKILSATTAEDNGAKRPLSWTGSLGDSLLGTEKRHNNFGGFSRPNSSYSSNAWDSDLGSETQNGITNSFNYDRLKNSTVTSGYGSFNEKLELSTERSIYDNIDVYRNMSKSMHYQRKTLNADAAVVQSRHSLPAIPRNASTFSCSSESESCTVVPLTNGLFIETQACAHHHRYDGVEALDGSAADEGRPTITVANTIANGEKTVIQASTSELLYALGEFIGIKCRAIVNVESAHVVAWLRAVDRALMVQGWQDVAFINPANLVFVYMLIRDHFERLSGVNETEPLSTVEDVQAFVLTCLYISYSYMGNEISYPLKPFIAESANRVEFWSRCVSIVNAHSTRMLQLNASSTFFLEMFAELKALSNPSY